MRMQLLGMLFIPLCLLLGICLIVSGAGDSHDHQLAVAGAILLGSVLISLNKNKP